MTTQKDFLKNPCLIIFFILQVLYCPLCWWSSWFICKSVRIRSVRGIFDLLFLEDLVILPSIRTSRICWMRPTPWYLVWLTWYVLEMESEGDRLTPPFPSCLSCPSISPGPSHLLHWTVMIGWWYSPSRLPCLISSVRYDVSLLEEVLARCGQQGSSQAAVPASFVLRQVHEWYSVRCRDCCMLVFSATSWSRSFSSFLSLSSRMDLLRWLRTLCWVLPRPSISLYELLRGPHCCRVLTVPFLCMIARTLLPMLLSMWLNIRSGRRTSLPPTVMVPCFLPIGQIWVRRSPLRAL